MWTANFRKKIFFHCIHRVVRRSWPFSLRLTSWRDRMDDLTGPRVQRLKLPPKVQAWDWACAFNSNPRGRFRTHVSPSIWRQSYVRRLQLINNVSQVLYVCSYSVVGSALLWNWFTMSGGLEVLQLKEEDVQKFLAAQAHLGDHNVTLQMAQYVYKVRSDGKWV